MVDVLVKYDQKFAETEGDIFNSHLKLFSHFYGGQSEEESTPKTELDIPATDSNIEVITE